MKRGINRPGRTRPSRYETVNQRVEIAVASASLGGVALLLSSLELHSAGMWVVSLAHVVLGYYVFLRAGGDYLTPTGLYFGATALFLGVAGVMALLDPTVGATWYLVVTSVAVHASNILFFLVRFRRPSLSRAGAIFIDRPSISGTVVSMSWKLGTILLATGVVLNATGLPLGNLDSGMVFIAITSLFVSLVAVAGRRRIDRSAPRIVGVVVGFLLFSELFFGGFGRLLVATLLLSGLVIVNMREPRRWHKQLPVLILIPALVVSGVSRTDLQGSDASLYEVLAEGEGLESLYNPLTIFAEIIESDHSSTSNPFPRQYGVTFVEAVLIPIPRAWWPDKPPNFGTKLTAWRTPELVDSGTTWAALAHGEWYANFGWLGFLLAPGVLAPLFQRFDEWHVRLLGRGVIAPTDLLWLLMFVTLAVGILEYVWIGLATYAARAGQRALVIGLLTLILVELSGQRARSRSD